MIQEIVSVIEAIDKNIAAVKALLTLEAPSIAELEQVIAQRLSGPLFDELSRVGPKLRQLVTVAEERIFQAHFGLLGALELEVGGLGRWLKENEQKVSEDFARAFNLMAMHLHVAPIHPDSVKSPEAPAGEPAPAAEPVAEPVASDVPAPEVKRGRKAAQSEAV